MALDPSIFGMIGRGVKSVNDYDMEAAQLDQARAAGEANKLSLLLNRQKADEYTRGVGEQNRLRSISQNWNANTTDEERIASLKNAGFAGQADALEKGLLERQKTAAQVSKDSAEAKNKEYETGRKRYEHRIAGLSQFQDVDGAKQWLADSVHTGDLGIDEATRMIQNIPMDPAAFGEWKNKTIFALQDVAKQAGYFQPDANAVLSAKTSADNNAANNTRQAQAHAETVRHNKAMEDAAKVKAALASEKSATGKPLPASALKMQQESLDAIGTAKSISTDLDSLLTQMNPTVGPNGAKSPPALQLGPVQNLLSSVKNATGFSDKNSRNYNSLNASLVKLQNDSLRLNKGVQTEGDSQRAWKELMSNLNDQENVKQRLSEIKDINERGARLHQANVDVTRQNYGLEPLDMDAYLSQVPVVGAKKVGRPAQSQLGASSRVGGQAPRPAATPAAPAAGPKFLGFE